MNKHFVIVGGGTAGWMTAMIMAKAWSDKKIRVSLVESASVGTIGVGEGSTPALQKFFEQMDIPESEWMPACNATYKCGITFDNWSTKAGFTQYFHPFPSVLDSHTLPVFIRNAQARLTGQDVDANPDRFFLSSRLAQQHLAPKAHYNFPFDLQYGYHFDAALLGAFLRTKALQLGVIHRQSHVHDVALKEDGDIDSLLIDGGEKLSADFFVDCSGFSGLLLQQTLRTAFVSYGQQLFNDAAVALPSTIEQQIPSQTRSTALTHGWAWKIPLVNRFGNGYVYSSSFCTADQAEKELREHLGLLDADTPARHLKMKVGRVEKSWHRNCLAVGLAQGFIEPLEATALFLVQQTAALFVKLYNQGKWTTQYQAEFNQQINAQFDGTRDYVVTHYKTSSRKDSEYWRANTADPNNVSDSLRDIYRTWMSGGDLAAELHRQNATKYYPVMSWYCLFAGMGIFPESGVAKATTKQPDLRQIDKFLSRCLMNFDDHRQVLNALSKGGTH